jgi:predicted acylesterase/phospholipase RssA
MIDFTLTEQQRNIREPAHDFAQKEIRPVAWEYDRDATWPQEIIRKAWEAVDVVTGQELRLSSGPVLDAILASAAIPGVLQPVSWEDRTLMDGGVANNTPISHAVELGAERIYVLPTGHACALAEPPSGALAMALHAISLLTHRRLIDDIERHRDDAHLIVMPPPCPLIIQPVDFAHAAELIDVALLDAREFLDSGGETRAPIRMRMHRHALTPERAPRAQPATEANPPTIAP